MANNRNPQFHDGMFVNGVWLDHIDPENSKRAYFICPDCGSLFRVFISKVRYNVKTKCNVCTGKIKYQEGHRYGPENILLVKLIDRTRAEFECPRCHKHFISTKQNVVAGKTRSCGCLKSQVTRQRNTKNKNLVGLKFGHLTVLRRADEARSKKGRHYYWECECDCDEHNHIIVPTNHLRSGLTTSCGCVHRQAVRDALIKDLTGKSFGLLTVIRQAEDHISASGRTSVAWHCRCDCIDGQHRYIDVPSSSLLDGRRVACPICTKKTSHGEILIQEILTEYSINFIREQQFRDCLSPKGGYLKFDFYLPDMNICIEYDGIQHFKQSTQRLKQLKNYWSGYCYEQVNSYDMIKNCWCKEHGIEIIRIPYTYYKRIYDNHQLLIDILNLKHQVILPEY